MSDPFSIPEDATPAELREALARSNSRNRELETQNAEKLGLGFKRIPEKGDAQRLLHRQFPYLASIPELSTVTRLGADDHVLIEGDNLPVLAAYSATRGADVDVIYIDPPYNTGDTGDGSAFVYNDRRVSADDPVYHSAWLSFMEPRLVLARNSLRDTGVIMVAIGDDEDAHLKLLLDKTFGANNFVGRVTWAGRNKAISNLLSASNDYFFIYAKHYPTVIQSQWRSQKPGIVEMVAAAEKCWDEYQSAAPATAAFRKWFNALPKTHALKGAKRVSNNKTYLNIDELGQVYRLAPIEAPGGGGGRYDVLHPRTGRPVKLPALGWSIGEDKMATWVESAKVVFGADESTVPKQKILLGRTLGQVLSNSIDVDRAAATQELAHLIGKGSDGKSLFNNPKDRHVIAQWIDYVTPQSRKDESETDPIVVMDFFAGSGTTGHAVLQLNAQDNVKRRFVLVTNNEDPTTPDQDADTGVARDVTAVRLHNAITGAWADGKERESYDANLHYYRLQWRNVAIADIGETNAERFEGNYAGLAALHSGAHHLVECNAQFTVLRDAGNLTVIWGDYYAALLDPEDVDEVLDRVRNAHPGLDSYTVFAPSGNSHLTLEAEGWVFRTFPSEYIARLNGVVAILKNGGSLVSSATNTTSEVN